MNWLRIEKVLFSAISTVIVCLCCLSIFTFSHDVVAGTLVVVPPGFEEVEGNNFGFTTALPTQSVILQEVYTASEFPELSGSENEIAAMRMRADKMVTEPRVTEMTYELSLSTTDAVPGTLDPVFDNNRGDDQRVVYRGPIQWATDGDGPIDGPNGFDYVVDFQTRFPYHPSSGRSLLVEEHFIQTLNAALTDTHDSPDSSGVRRYLALLPALEALDGSQEATVRQFEFVPESSVLDFNEDSHVDVLDVDALVGEIVAGTNRALFDLTGDGGVDDADLTQWRSEAATSHGFGQAYLAGDSNLDCSVDAADLNNLALNWRLNVASWSGGDFTADGVVNSEDLNQLALNWQQSIPTASVVSAPVPEPSAWLMTVVGLALVYRRSRQG